MKVYQLVSAACVLLILLGFPMLPRLLDAEDSNNTPQALASDLGALESDFKSMDDIRCDKVNGTDMMRQLSGNPSLQGGSFTNEYLNMALDENNKPTNFRIIIDEFKTEQDRLFAERIDELMGTDVRCDLSQSNVPDAYADKRIKPLAEFLSGRIFDLRQADCALFHIKHSTELLCPHYDTKTQQVAWNCETRIRKEIETLRQNLLLAMKLSIMQLDEMYMAWPVHKRFECLNESMIDYREVLVEFLEIYSKFPEAFLNASQST